VGYPARVSYRVLHFADLHLDAPFAWAPPEAARIRRRNRRGTLTRILELAEAERVDALFCAGDLFEHERIGPDTIEFLRTSFAATERPIFLAPGNHDWYSARSPYALVDWSPNVHLFTEPQLEPVELAEGLTLWGAAHRAPANTDGFFTDFRVSGAGVHIALAHASERSALGWQESGKQPHAPFDDAELAASGLQHAFLGHYHLPRDAERYTYPGNPDPLEFGEQGLRGIVLATIGPDGRIERERRDVSVSAVHDIAVSVAGAVHSDQVRDLLREALAPLTGSVRATLVGEVAPSVQVDLRELSRLADGLDGLVIRSDVVTGYDLDSVAEEATVRGQFLRDAAAEIDDPAIRRRVVLTGLRALEGRTDLEVA
jgi:DNA repair protein SbcD/Mre11